MKRVHAALDPWIRDTYDYTKNITELLEQADKYGPNTVPPNWSNDIPAKALESWRRHINELRGEVVRKEHARAVSHLKSFEKAWKEGKPRTAAEHLARAYDATRNMIWDFRASGGRSRNWY